MRSMFHETAVLTRPGEDHLYSCTSDSDAIHIESGHARHDTRCPGANPAGRGGLQHACIQKGLTEFHRKFSCSGCGPMSRSRGFLPPTTNGSMSSLFRVIFREHVLPKISK